MNGNIKFIKEVSWEADEKSGNIIKGERKRFDYELDSLRCFCKKGNLVEEIFYTPDDSIIYSIVHKYDGIGNLIEEITYRNNKKDNYRIFIHDEVNNGIEEIMRNSDESLIYKCHKKYSDEGKIIESICITSEEITPSKTTWLYDDIGNMIEMNTYNCDGILEDKRISKYDNSGNCIEWTHYNFDGSMDSKYLSKYDNLNNEIEWNKIYDSDIEFVSSIRKTWKYEIDNIGNWICRIYFEDNIPKSIVERKIEYYKIENNSIVKN